MAKKPNVFLAVCIAEIRATSCASGITSCLNFLWKAWGHRARIENAVNPTKLPRLEPIPCTPGAVLPIKHQLQYKHRAS